MRGSLSFWLRRGLMGLSALAVGYASGNRPSDAPRPEVNPAPSSLTTNAPPKLKASTRPIPDPQEIYLLPFNAVTAARWRQWLRDAPLPDLESAITAACAQSPDWIEPSLEAWAERDDLAARNWMLANAPGRTTALLAWLHGITLIAPEKARAWFDESAETDCKTMNAQMTEIRQGILRTWAGVDPERALAAWKLWEGPTRDSDPKNRSQFIPQEIYEGLAGLPESQVLDFLAKHPEPFDSVSGLETLIASHPDRWLPLACLPDASPSLKNAANSYAKANPRWTMEHLEDLDPSAREPMTTTVLGNAHDLIFSGIRPTLAGKPLTSWLEGLTPENRASVIGGVAGVELMHDSNKALALMQGNNRSGQAKEFYESAALFGAIEPRLMEQQIMNAEGSPEEVTRLRLAFAAGVQGVFSSPHDAMCRAISFQDEGLRHTAIALTLVNQTDPDVRQATFDWLDGMPAGTVNKAQLQDSLQQLQSNPERWAALENNKPIPAGQFTAVDALIKTLP